MAGPQLKSLNSFGTLTDLKVDKNNYRFHSLKQFEKASGRSLAKMPFSLKILLENLLRYEDGVAVKKKDIEALAQWNPKAEPDTEIQFMPSRVLLQDFTGVPAVADLAAMRGALKKLGGNPVKINPLQPADLVIDHSVQVDSYGNSKAFQENADLEFSRNFERYQFLRWGASAFQDFRVVPPDTGIVHQINLEYLAPLAMTRTLKAGSGTEDWIYPDTVIGTDSHTTMINGLGVLGWGVGGIEAEAALLGQPCTMLIPQVIGFRLKGKLSPGVTATDLVLTVTQMLRKKGVVGKFVEFFGPALASMTLADRATIANMAPEYGATCGIFPIDEVTTDYLKLTGRTAAVELVKQYYQAQGLWYSSAQPDSDYTDTLELDLASVEPSLAGPARPQDRVALAKARGAFRKFTTSLFEGKLKGTDPSTLKNWVEDESAVQQVPEYQAQSTDQSLGHLAKSVPLKFADGSSFHLKHGSVVLASITSCTNTSNPSVLIAAGLLAKKAVEHGLTVKPWVKTSLAPGSKTVTDYLRESGLTPYLEALRFHVVGYGCATCIGNSGPLSETITDAIIKEDLAVVSVLSGNRNFEGRVHPNIKANYLASPPLVVAYALAGSIHINLSKDPLGYDTAGRAVYLKDIWPSQDEVNQTMKRFITSEQYSKSYSDVFKGDEAWQKLKVPTGDLYQWDTQSTYIKEPPFFDQMSASPAPLVDIKAARALAVFGDSITTDHISPAGNISKSSPAGLYLQSLGVQPKDFNSYGARRGNHEVMARGTFANVRIKNLMVAGVEGGVTIHQPSGKQMPIYDASMQYQSEKVPLVVIAGKEYGTGSSRDWAAKGPKLLGVRAVIAESFERIHRSNLVGMGILPLQFKEGENRESLGLSGKETFDIEGLGALQPGQNVTVRARGEDGKVREFSTRCRIDTPNELEYFKHGGILLYVLRQQLKA
jgi:aconitate hydratase